MSPGWVTVLAVGAATIVIKSAGPVLIGGRQLPVPVLGVVALLPAALLAALVAVLTLGAPEGLTTDARLIGVGIGALATVLRAPVLLVVVLAGVATALARAAGLT